jgi:catechol 2,3-dioxygenase-like lactoylglutathione lyase family enzyme
MRDVTAHAAIAVSDLGRARKFYEESLGLDIKEERPDGIRYETGGTWFFVYPSSFAGTNQATSMAFVVGDFDAAFDELEERGIAFERYDLPGLKTNDRGVAEIEGQRAAWFKDPDGNILALDQRS